MGQKHSTRRRAVAARHSGPWSVVFCAACCASIAVRAEPAPRAAASVETIVVTATRTERDLADQPDSISVVTAAQIDATPAQSLDDVLRTVQSVDVPIAASYQIHPTANSVSMRGLGGIRALVLLDGVPINDPFFGYVQWNRVPMQRIDRVEVVRGGGSPLWGNYAMGGVINIITRSAAAPGASVEGGYGSDGTYRAQGDASLALTDTVSLDGTIGGWGTDGFDQIAHRYGPIYRPTSFDAVNASATARFDTGTDLRGYLRFNYHDNDQTLTTPTQTNRQRVYDYTGSVSKTFGRSDLAMTAFHESSHFDTDNTNTPDGVAAGFGEYLQNRHQTPVDTSGASLIWSTRLDGVVRLASLGTDYQQIDGEDAAKIYDETGALLRTDIGRGKQRFVGVFAQLDLYPVERLEVLASVRYQYIDTYDGVDITPGGLGRVPDRSDDSVDPRVSLRYQLLPSVALRGAAYSSFRAPNLDNLYRAFSVPFGIFYPNPQLKPESLDGGEVGFDVEWRQLRAQVTAYHSEIDDLLTYRNLDPAELPPGFFFGSRNINAGKATAEGIEAALQWPVSDALTAALSYTYARSTIDDNEFDPASVGNQIAGIPRHQASGEVAYAASRGWRASMRVRWLDESWGDNDNTLRLDSHVVVDASLSYPLTTRVDAFVDVENLLDERYVADNSGFNPPLWGTPLSVFAGVRVRFD